MSSEDMRAMWPNLSKQLKAAGVANVPDKLPPPPWAMRLAHVQWKAVLPYVDPRYVGCAYVHDLAAVLAGDAKLARLLEAAGRFGAFEKLTFSSQSAALVEIGLALRDFRGEA